MINGKNYFYNMVVVAIDTLKFSIIRIGFPNSESIVLKFITMIKIETLNLYDYINLEAQPRATFKI